MKLLNLNFQTKIQNEETLRPVKHKKIETIIFSLGIIFDSA